MSLRRCSPNIGLGIPACLLSVATALGGCSSSPLEGQPTTSTSARQGIPASAQTATAKAEPPTLSGSPSPSGSDRQVQVLGDLFMFDRTAGIALITTDRLDRAVPVGTGVFVTTDGARHFTPVGVPAWTGQPPVTHLRFSDRSHGYAFGDGLFVTHDGGGTWAASNISGQVISVATSGGRAWALVASCLVVQTCSPPSIWTTTDYGSSWTPSAAQPFPARGRSQSGTVAALDRSTAYAMAPISDTADGSVETTFLAITRDGGLSWQRLANPCGPPFGGKLLATPLHGAVLWLVCDEDPGLNHDTIRVYRSLDGGHSWHITSESTAGFDGRAATISESCCAVDLATLDATSAWIASGNAALLGTFDAGQHWENVLHSDVGDGHRVLFLDSSIGFAFADNRIWATTDGGRTWAVRYDAGPSTILANGQLFQ